MFMCEICKKEKAKYMVTLPREDNKYPFKITYRCEECKDRALRSHDVVDVERL
jgi:hypothetical protein